MLVHEDEEMSVDICVHQIGLHVLSACLINLRNMSRSRTVEMIATFYVVALAGDSCCSQLLRTDVVDALHLRADILHNPPTGSQ